MGQVIDSTIHAPADDGASATTATTSKPMLQHVMRLGVALPQLATQEGMFAALAVLCVFGAAASFVRVTLLNVASERIAKRMRTDLFDTLIHKVSLHLALRLTPTHPALPQEVAFFDKTRTGELINRLSADTVVAAKGVTETLSFGLRSTISGIAARPSVHVDEAARLHTALGGSTVLWFISPQLCSVALVVLPPLGTLAMLYGRFVRSLSSQVKKELALANTVAEGIAVRS
jgi:ATP-binding cassette subfamily B (MDR/TAP) protein 10